MPSQQELTDFGRMDLLHAVRLWGGFTTVADRLGVLPNTRSVASCQPILLAWQLCHAVHVGGLLQTTM